MDSGNIIGVTRPPVALSILLATLTLDERAGQQFMAEIGYIALAIAFGVSVYSIVAFISGAKWGVRLLVSSARKSVVIVSGLVSI